MTVFSQMLYSYKDTKCQRFLKKGQQMDSLCLSANNASLAEVSGKYTTVAKFIVPDWGDKVDLRHRVMAGRYDNPLPELTLFPRQGLQYMNLATCTVQYITQ